MLPEPYLLAIYTLALASLARLITIDSLLERPRDALVGGTVAVSQWAQATATAVTERLDDRPWTSGRAVAILTRAGAAALRFTTWCLGSLLTCPWCLGFWLALGLLACRAYWQHPIALTLALAMAMRQVAGLLADR